MTELGLSNPAGARTIGKKSFLHINERSCLLMKTVDYKKMFHKITGFSKETSFYSPPFQKLARSFSFPVVRAVRSKWTVPSQPLKYSGTITPICWGGVTLLRCDPLENTFCFSFFKTCHTSGSFHEAHSCKRCYCCKEQWPLCIMRQSSKQQPL